MRIGAFLRVGMLVAAAGSTGCLPPRVVVLRSGTGVTARPRPPDCRIDFFRTRVDRPYDELAAIHADGGDMFRDGPQDFEEVLRRKACELGADAIIVTEEWTGIGGRMTGTAIRYRDVTASAAVLRR